jgi:hypothetical protein
MWKLRWLVLLLGLAAFPARAQEVVLGTNLSGRWDSDVVSNPNAQSDFSLRAGPDLRLSEPQGALTYDIHYVPTYQAYSRLSGLDAWEHYVNASGQYHLSAATSMDASETFDYVPESTIFLQQLTVPGAVTAGTSTVSVVGHNTVLINTANVALHHFWTERWQSDLTLASQYYEPQVQGSISTNVISGATDLTYGITPLDRIGASLGATSQQFGSNGVQNSSTTYFYNLSGIWNHQFSPTWSLQMQAGPTLVKSPTVSTPSLTPPRLVFPSASGGGQTFAFDFSSCGSIPLIGPVFERCGALLSTPVTNSTVPSLATVNTETASLPVTGQPASSGTNLTYFANIVTTKQWENLTFSFGFNRGAGTSGVFTTSTVSNTLNGSVTWLLSPLWTATLGVLWTDQSSSSTSAAAVVQKVQGFPSPAIAGNLQGKQAAKITGVAFEQQSNNINVYQWIIGAHVDYKVTKRLSTFANFFYLNQTGSGPTSAAFNASNLALTDTRIDLGLHYEFDPIHLSTFFQKGENP